jgi:hypothetical protein
MALLYTVVGDGNIFDTNLKVRRGEGGIKKEKARRTIKKCLIHILH